MSVTKLSQQGCHAANFSSLLWPVCTTGEEPGTFTTSKKYLRGIEIVQSILTATSCYKESESKVTAYIFFLDCK